MEEILWLLLIIILCEAVYGLSQIQWIRTAVKTVTAVVTYAVIIFAAIVGLRALLAN